ncbi:tetratricopeptide repeat protein [Solihabitans fulvus]|uniref:Tetratricopeptide repeat protein n=1 Tax=Solihabitans fulvus TaxID=1892852 RepID=A0A5B2XDG5_9PSEU|nr:tetratricopeptide repeat protein [Solihabitans fulvus]KAA2261266.1 tetratricopeptide repeat protein [Solihabitans fulvus]
MGEQTPNSHNELSGSVGVAVQVGSVHGGLQLNVSAPETPVPHQFPDDPAMVVNQIVPSRRVRAALTAPVEDAEARIIVLHGSSGTGKCWIAQHCLHACRDDYPDGQLYVDLSTAVDELTATSEALREFLMALGTNPALIPTDLAGRQKLYRSVTDGKALQVLVRNAFSPAQARALRPGRGRSVLVVTGHGLLGGLKWESAAFVELDPFEPDAARELLGRFAGDEVLADVAAVNSILDMCDHRPKAIEVVGAILADRPWQSIAELAEELADGSALSAELSAVFDAVYRRLGAVAKRCYHAIGLHPGRGEFGREVLAAALDVSDREAGAAINQLRALHIIDEARPHRYVMHNLVRAHAHEVAWQPDARAESDTLIRRTLAWYLARAVAADDAVMPLRGWREQLLPALEVRDAFATGGEAFGWLEQERANLRAAVVCAAERQEDEVTYQFCVVLWSLHERGKYFDDLVATNSLGVAAARRKSDVAVESLLWSQLGFPPHHQGEETEAVEAFERAREAARRAGHLELEATAIEGLGLARLGQGRTEEAVRLLRENLRLAEEIGKARRIALARFHLAKAVDAEEAVRLLTQTARTFEELGEVYNLAKARTWLGRKLIEIAEPDDAERVLADAMRTMIDDHTPFDQAQVLEGFAELAVARDELADARERYAAALSIYEGRQFTRQAESVRRRLAELGSPNRG